MLAAAGRTETPNRSLAESVIAKARLHRLRLRSSLPGLARVAVAQARTYLATYLVPRGSRRRQLYDYLKKTVSRFTGERAARLPDDDHRRASRSYAGSALDSKPIDLVPFPAFSEPEVSIIIPMRDQLSMTVECLRSVQEMSGGASFEVIVVDDASAPGTSAHLSGVENLRVLANSTNLGFVRSCNLAAAEARGECLLFLNNDTRVRAGWLSALVETMRSNESIGLVGAKLVYPDGRLQEAGSLIWSDGTGCNYGKNQDASLPEFNFVREVDYCSGACLLVRKKVFEQAGGFDLRYVPAYYEDSDLAFTARRLGYITVYQPKAEVVHFEGISNGSNPAVGIKRHQAVNQEKFAEKWSAAIQDHYPFSKANLLLARDGGRRPKALVIDNDVPYFDQDAGGLRLDAVVELLQDLGFGVVFLAHNRYAPSPYRERLQQRGVEVLFGGVDVKSFVKQLAPVLRLCIASRPAVAWRYVSLIRKHAPDCKLIYDTVDLHFMRELRRAEVEKSARLKRASDAYKALELGIARQSDATLAVSEAEAAVVSSELVGSKVYVLPTIHAINSSPNSFEGRSGLLFVGSFAHPPNAAAIRNFVENIFPLVRTELPEVQFHVVGKASPSFTERMATYGVCFHGWVEDLDSYLQGCRLMVAPLTFGAGVKGKLTQALSCGLPVVTTSVGAEGIGIVDGRHGLIADEPALFARKVVDLYADPELWTRVSLAGLDLARRCFSPDVARARLRSILTDLGCAP
jgi:GT2 family glycosyltransferase